MSPEIRPFVIYSAPAGLAVLILGGILWSKSADIKARSHRLDQAYRRYAEIYLGNSERKSAERAIELGKQRRNDQEEALTSAENALVARLPEEFLTDRFTNASGLQQRILVAIRAQAERTAISIPRNLPLDGGLNPDETARSLEMAQLYLLQQAMRILLNGPNRIDFIELDGGYCDPEKRYAVLVLNFRLQADFRTAYSMIRNLSEDAGGIGLRTCQLRPLAGDENMMEVSGSISLLTHHDPRWDLPVVQRPDEQNGTQIDQGRTRRRPARGR